MPAANAGAEEVRGISAATVSNWLAQNIAGAAPPFVFSPIPGGHSNLTYRVRDSAGQLFVLRRPPLGAVLATAHDMAREHKILSGVSKSDVPVPQVLGLCKDEAVNGAPFYVMAFVEGVVLASAADCERHIPEAARRNLGFEVADILARLHNVNVDVVGLGDLGRRENYIARQLKRWRTQWNNSKTRELPAMDTVYEALAADIPPQPGAGIVHGDYRLGNMLTQITDSGGARIAAVLDWELCTLGDPLADLAYVLNNWAEAGEPVPTMRGAMQAPSAAPGFPSRAELQVRYEAAAGRRAKNIAYYRAFQYWRSAAIVEGVMARYLKGVMGGDADTSAFRTQIDAMAESARQCADEMHSGV